MQSTKDKISLLVRQYKQNFAMEYAAFCTSQPEKKALQANEFGTIGKGDGVVERLLLEYPETLYGIFVVNLTSDEWKWFDSKIGIRWFAKTFSEFKIAEKI